MTWGFAFSIAFVLLVAGVYLVTGVGGGVLALLLFCIAGTIVYHLPLAAVIIRELRLARGELRVDHQSQRERNRSASGEEP